MRAIRSTRRVCRTVTRSTFPQVGPSSHMQRHQSSTSPPSSTKQTDKAKPEPQNKTDTPATHKKTVAEADAELKSRLEAMSGEGGAAGVEYENGSAEGLKREVKRNMFRLI